MKSRLRLSIALGDYDINQAILDGSICCSGLDLVAVTMPSPQRHWRMLMYGEFDIAELSLSSYAARVSRGEDDLVAIPAFPHRRFRHGYAFVSTAAGIRRPDDLVGKSIGVRNWQTTAGVWIRGILDEFHGVPIESVDWVAQDSEDVEMSLPDGVSLRRVEPGQSVTDMCATGQLHGLIYPEIPRQLLAGDNTIERVFSDPKSVEQDYYRRTEIFPIMHVVVIKKALVEQYPWLPRTVLNVFTESKRRSIKRLTNPRTVSLAWLRDLQEEEEALLGPDPWRYGLDRVNHHVLQTFLHYASRQGVTARSVDVEELFAASTIEPMPHYV